MTAKLYLFVCVFLLISMSACTTSQDISENRQEVVFDDKKTSLDTDNVVVTDADLSRQIMQNSSAGKKSQEQSSITGDGSKITTMIDSFGNKTEMRCFNNHPRLDCIVVQTSGAGKRQVTIYPAVKGAKVLPENMEDQALTASADELANSAGVYETRASQASKSVSPYDVKKDNKSLSPLPRHEFPIQIPQDQQLQNSETQNTDTPGEKLTDEPGKKEIEPLNSQSEEDMK